MQKAMWLVAMIGSLIGAIGLTLTLLASQSSPQEAAGAAISAALAVIPYCIARAVSELNKQ